jgi:hypothetical protein
MSRVEIHAADGRRVVVDHEGDLSYVKEKAMEIWEATKAPEQSPGPAYGFQAEKRWAGDVAAAGRGAYDRGLPVAPVTASSEGSGFAGPTPEVR